MSAHIRNALVRLQDDTAGLILAPSTQIRARGNSLRRRRIVGTAAAMVMVTAVGVFTVATVSDGSAAHTSVAPSPSGSPPPTTDCGTYVLGQGGQLPQAAITCFLDALAAGHPAQLTETRPTTEGDPIQSRYTADATGVVQVTVDTRQDRFGEQGVFRQTCTGPFVDHGHITFTHCSPRTRI